MGIETGKRWVKRGEGVGIEEGPSKRSLVEVFEKSIPKPEGEKPETSWVEMKRKIKEAYWGKLAEEIEKYEDYDPGDLFGEWKKTPHFHLYSFPREKLNKLNKEVYKETVGEIVTV